MQRHAPVCWCSPNSPFLLTTFYLAITTPDKEKLTTRKHHIYHDTEEKRQWNPQFVMRGTQRRCPFMGDVLERHTRPSKGRQNMEYKTQPGHLGMMRTDENGTTECRLDIIMITVEFNAHKRRARQILTTNWNTRKSRTSNAYQKMASKQVSSEIWIKLNMMQIFGHFVHVQRNFGFLQHTTETKHQFQQ